MFHTSWFPSAGVNICIDHAGPYSIDTDSFRATSILKDGEERFVIHYNKQAMRDYYKIAHAGWLAAVGEAKKDARAEGVPFVDILRSRQASGDVPEDLPHGRHDDQTP